MSDRISRRFEKLKAEGRPALVTYFMGGDPDFATSLSIMKALPQAGSDIIELGMPFSDPMADGPAIQAAGLRALKGGQTLARTLSMAAEFRKDDDETPIVMMGYYNPIYIYGVERFLSDAARDCEGMGEKRDARNACEQRHVADAEVHRVCAGLLEGERSGDDDGLQARPTHPPGRVHVLEVEEVPLGEPVDRVQRIASVEDDCSIHPIDRVGDCSGDGCQMQCSPASCEGAARGEDARAIVREAEHRGGGTAVFPVLDGPDELFGETLVEDGIVREHENSGGVAAARLVDSSPVSGIVGP